MCAGSLNEPVHESAFIVEEYVHWASAPPACSVVRCPPSSSGTSKVKRWFCAGCQPMRDLVEERAHIARVAAVALLQLVQDDLWQIESSSGESADGAPRRRPLSYRPVRVHERSPQTDGRLTHPHVEHPRHVVMTGDEAASSRNPSLVVRILPGLCAEVRDGRRKDSPSGAP